jgi:tetratricopeptide (TPR) repeat protein
LKAFFIVVVSVLIIGAAAFMLSGKTGGSPLSSSSQAVKLCEEGTADLNAFRLNDARDKLEACLELDPNLAEASISLAFTFARLGRSDEFKAALARADSLVGNIEDQDRRMMAQLRLTNASDSKFFSIRDSLLDRLEVEKPDNVEVLVALTYQVEDDEERVKAWQRVREADPNYAISYNMLGYLELARGNYDQAAQHMQKYAFLAPDLANPHDSLGDVYFAQGRYEEAESEYVKSVTMQPDFYASLINLGRTYLARGQIKKGVDILEKVRLEISGSKLEQRVDQQILETLITNNIEDKMGELARRYVAKWPKDGSSAVYRGMILAYKGEFAAGQAVVDSALTVWRISDHYKNMEDARRHVDRSGKLYQALVADLADSPSTRVRHWASIVAMDTGLALHDQWYDRWKLGEALLDNNQPQEALAQIMPVLEVNPRLITPLLLTVRIYLAEKDAVMARQVLDQAKHALSWADKDFPPVARVKDLEARVLELEGSS